MDINLLVTLGTVVAAVAAAWAVTRTTVVGMEKTIASLEETIEDLRKELRALPSVNERLVSHAERLKDLEHQLREMVANRVRQEDVDEIKQEVREVHSAVSTTNIEISKLSALLAQEFAKRRKGDTN